MLPTATGSVVACCSRDAGCYEEFVYEGQRFNKVVNWLGCEQNVIRSIGAAASRKISDRALVEKIG